MNKTLGMIQGIVSALLGLAIVALLGAAVWIGYTYFLKGKIDESNQIQTIKRQNEQITELSDQVEKSNSEIKDLNDKLSKSADQIKDLGEQVTEKQIQIDALVIEVAEKDKKIDHLNTAMRLLKVDHRVARITALRQEGSEEAGDLVTHLSFVELDDEENPLDQPRFFQIKGDVVYIDAWVMKFNDESVEAADPLRSTSVCLLRRLFGESQSPNEGFPIDKEGDRPTAYGDDQEINKFERDLWRQFWEYANDAKLAKQAGLRAAHGEAPSIKLIPGQSYRLMLRASGGLTIVPEDAS